MRLCGYKGMSDGLLLQHFTVNGIRITIKLHYRKTVKPYNPITVKPHNLTTP